MLTGKKLFQTVIFSEILQGLKLTLKHMLKGNVITEQYPHEKPNLPDGWRGAIVHLRYDDGTEKCVGCALCEAACPSHCITVISAERPDLPQKRIAETYILDMTKCVFCGFCVQACPVNALASSKEYELATRDKRELVMTKDTMLTLGDQYFPVREKRPVYSNARIDLFEGLKAVGFPKAKKGHDS